MSIKEWHSEQQAEKLAKLNERLGKAEERKEEILNSIRDKARQESDKMNENHFIMSLKKENLKIDINDKITETVQRRRQILNTIKTRQEDRAAREEAAEKRRKQIREESRDMFLAKTQKLAKAQARKQRIL